MYKINTASCDTPLPWNSFGAAVGDSSALAPAVARVGNPLHPCKYKIVPFVSKFYQTSPYIS